MKPSRYAASAPVRTVADDGKPKVPEFCGVLYCMTRRVKQPNGEWKYAQGFADVVIKTPDGEFIPRCADHYLQQIYKTGHGKDCDIMGRDWLMGIDAVKTFRANLPEPEETT